jgi:hypothetical protein
MDERRCTARSSQTGEPCKRFAIVGGTVCSSHGGSAPAVKDAARRRLLELVDPALVRLRDLLGSDDERVALQACRLVLDRAGIPTDDDPALWLTPEVVAAEIARLEAELELGEE